MSRTLVTVSGIRKKFGSTAALDEVSFDIRAGEVLGIIGPSGGGKSTLLRCLALLSPIDDGEIAYALPNTDAVAVTSEGAFTKGRVIDSAEVRRPIGFVFQGLHLWADRTVMDNLTLAPRVVRRVDRHVAEERALCLSKQFGIEDKVSARTWQLSGGQRQRVAIVRALMMEPDLLLLDEVTSALDPVLTADVMHAIRELKTQGMTMVIVTHHLRFAERLCDRLMFVEGGRVLEIGDVQKVLRGTGNASVSRFFDILEETR